MPDTPDDKTLSESAVQVSFASIGPYRLIQMLGVGGMGEEMPVRGLVPQALFALITK